MNHSKELAVLQSKQHFHILDGLRGIAALAVVVFHFMEWIIPDFTQNFIGHGFLAVDFFFCLSGFVIAYAYDKRLPQMGIRAFFTSRLIRLHPLVIIGTLLGLLGLFLDPFADHASAHSPGNIALIFVCALLMIPLPVMEERFFNLFSLNAHRGRCFGNISRTLFTLWFWFAFRKSYCGCCWRWLPAVLYG